MKIIHKKILPEYMEEVIKGRKTFELRKDEDDIQEGDILILEEWEDGKYKNVSVNAEVTYVLRDKPEYGLKPGYCIIGLACSSNIIYNRGKEDGRAEAITTVINLIEDIHIKTYYCTEDECDDSKSCDICLFEAIKKNLEHLEEQKE